ncbi:uncharacterized protein LOC124117145 isoform X1 [Haliotis rufescens]|uniref:uncharacterized protein LOC124117145 isoform X1 n=2 Tax=Haliotis rufescens TaxID=6454 RepID=UPI00201F6DBA|nr:uncharacterized protein LOC124117145 isoform X1 [Haliotis rufescens]
MAQNTKRKLDEGHDTLTPPGQRSGEDDHYEADGDPCEGCSSAAEEGPMTSAHKNLLTRNRARLAENMVPDDLFCRLSAKEILTLAEERRIKAKATWEGMNAELLDHVVRRSDKAFSVLEASLRESCQGHLADLLCGEDGEGDCGERLMTEENKQAILDNRVDLTNDITPDEVFNDLIADGIITVTEVKRIQIKNTREAMNEELLNYLVRRCDRGFRVFVNSLKKTGQDHLAKRLNTPSQRLGLKRKKLKSLSIPPSDACCSDLKTPSIHTPLPKANQNPSYKLTANQNSGCISQIPSTSLDSPSRDDSLQSTNKIPATSETAPSTNQIPSYSETPNSTTFHQETFQESVLANQVPYLLSNQNISPLTNQSMCPLTNQSSTSNEGSCSLEDVKQQIVLMAENAYANIRRSDDSGEAFVQFSQEMAQTTESINESLKVYKMIKDFCQRSDDEAQGHDGLVVPDGS